MTALLALEGISKRYPGVRALDEVSLDVAPGEVHALAGENGAGKSTLMKILAGAVRPDGGRMLWRGRPVAFAQPRDALAAGIRVIHQELSLVGELSVAENLFLGREPSRFGLVRRAELHERAREVLGRLQVRIDPARKVARLSLAERQVVEIARALGGEARLLAMDEPTSALDRDEVAHLHALVAQLAAAGTSILYISHRLDELPIVAHRVTVLRDGKVVATRPMRELPIPELVRLMVGRTQAEPATVPSVARPEPALRVQAEGLDLTVARGEVVGLAGLLGSGRTSLLRSIFRAPRQAIAAGIAFAPEDRKRQALLLQRSVRDNIVLADLEQLARWGLIQPGAERAAAERWVRDLGIRTPSIEQPVKLLSGGNQQKVVLARWLHARPKVLLLDEPTRGVDVGAKAEIHQLIRSLAKDGMAIVVASSEWADLLALCDRIVVLREHRAAGILARGDASEERIVALATGMA